MTDSSAGPAASDGLGGRARVFMAGLLTVTVFAAMSTFGGMSYASNALHGGPNPSVDQYCPSTGEPDANGDLHSNCHTGRKHRGAGGEDKPGSKG
jgi:hypothetical protein